MKGSQVNVTLITRKSHLNLFPTATNADSETILRQDESFQVQVSV
ncbi:hypothetical protein AVDCRST_MAG92-5523 [uncultured Coleofasciculus sp.]|uniref:Uncharacterized protein n=1 Tax=uncultured Coleofasciculus sp. TaxID=1267456 RepID=A0A6J4KIW5_9CYAN|nr:hypothetical protein AVDCRST_MAG92-5523 [uncultured Coleofasciculus sp.]